jgi:uncharacterized membrane protein (GlpM family)
VTPPHAILVTVSGEPSLRASWVLCGVALAVGAMLRFAPCFGDLWLDEIWSIERVRGLDAALEIFTGVHHSNNHHLMSLWLYLIANHPSEALTRLPSWLAGVVSIALMGVLGARRGRLDAIFATLLGASCFALLHFASEARGYAVAVACALLAQYALIAHLDDRRGWGAPVFAIAVTLGFLAHQTLLFYWAGAMAWSGWRARNAEGSVGARSLAWLRLHAVPLAAWGILYALDLRWLEVGGGDRHDALWLTSRLIAFVLGAPLSPAVALPGAIGLALVLGVALFRMARRGDEEWIVFAVTILVAPLVVMTLLRPDVVALRYFLISIAFGVLLAASLLADAFRSGRPGRIAVGVILALFVAGNGLHTARFLEHGRGGYRAALAFMAERSPTDEISVGADHEFRTGLVLQHYARRLPRTHRLMLARRDRASSAPREGPEWRVVHRAENPVTWPDHVRDDSGRRYAFAAAFPHAAISGFHWTLYRRDSPASTGKRRSNTIPNP